MKRNVLDWLTGEVSDARHALILTHNISFLFVQSILLPRLRTAGNPRLTIFADAACATGAWRRERSFISGLGVQYRVVPVDLGPWRRFHPKALLLASQARAALAIGSGNLTHGGMGANHEAWVFSTSYDDGAPRISAFREYVLSLVDQLPLADPLRETVDTLFDSNHPWVPTLPQPGRLMTAPSNSPILEKLVEEAGAVQSATILAPYYDDRCEALRECARRFSAPVTTLLQPGRTGLWAGAANGLPSSVTLKSIEDQGEKSLFIHAKIMALHRGEDVLLAVGSANCSRAALLAGPYEGNAELMAWDIVQPEAFETLLAEFDIGDTAPELPTERPSDDWVDEPRNGLRILAARQEAGVLQIAFSSEAEIRELVVLGEGLWPAGGLDIARGLAWVRLSVRLRMISIRAITMDGTTIESSEAWVDDEAGLSAPATLRRVFKSIAEVEKGDSNGTRKYEALLEVFSDYLRDPEAARRHLRRKEIDGPLAPYDPAAVFDEGFGYVAMPSYGDTVGSQGMPSILSVIEALFNFSRETGSRPSQSPTKPCDREQDDTLQDEVLDSDLVPDDQSQPDTRLMGAVARTVGRVEKALLEPEFVTGRSPALLSADIGLAATILVVGLVSRHLSVEAFRETTRRLWGALFFGDSGHPSAIAARLAIEQSPEAFMAEFANPRLTAVLSIWCTTEWTAVDGNAAWFRLSAAVLQSKCPMLFASAQPESIAFALQDIMGALLPANEQVAYVRTWRAIVRAGKAIELLQCCLKNTPLDVLQSVPRNVWLEATELVWAGKELGFPTTRVRHEAKTKISVRPLGVQTELRFLGAFVFPVRELVNAGVLDLPHEALPEILEVVRAFEVGECGVS